MINAKDIELFQNLFEFKHNAKLYDFHNDFLYENMIFANNTLQIFFKNICKENRVMFKFVNVEIIALNFFSGEMTADLLYRGRFEENGSLKEFLNQKGYFYLEFFEGLEMEFWAEEMDFLLDITKN